MTFCIVLLFATCSVSRYVCCFALLLSWRPLLYHDLVAIELLRVSFLLSPFVPRNTEIPALEIWLLFCLLCLKHIGPRDKITPTLPNLGKRQHSLQVGHPLRKANVNGVPLRKPLLVWCSLMGGGHDVYFTHNAGCHAIDTKAREEIDLPQRRKV